MINLRPLPFRSYPRCFTFRTPYLCRLYKKERGLTPESEIIGKRLRLAASLLCSTQKPIYEVANESGYRDELHFAKSFRKHYGTSPREYRKENREL